MDVFLSLFSASIESGRINYAFASLVFYDYILCFAHEIDYFWSIPLSLSGILYLSIRYLSLGFSVLSVVGKLSLSSLFMLPLITFTPKIPCQVNTLLMIRLFVFVVPISILCQAVITLRIWFLFSRKLAVKIFAVTLLIVTAIASILLVVLQWDTIRAQVLHPQLSSPRSFAWVYVPSLVSHTVFFALKVYRFLTSSVKMQTDTLLWGFVKEGMFMYVFALASLSFGVVGLSMVEPSQLPIRMPAAVASPIVAAVALSVCRVMLSIRSVAATAHVDPEWLLNHAELSRVRWKRGGVGGEIIVEVGEPAGGPKSPLVYYP